MDTKGREKDFHMDYYGSMCRSTSQGGRRCDDNSTTCKSRNRLLSKKRYLEKTGKNTASVEADLALLQEAHHKYGDIVLSHQMSLDSDTVKLMEDLSQSGFTPLVVGGAVRDSMSTGGAPKDIDIEVHDAPSMNALVRMLRRNGYRVDEVGRSFGVLKTTLPNGMDIDISLPRRDSLVGDGHRGFQIEVDPEMDIYAAAARRDFTINALYYDHSRHCVVDPYKGADDLKNGVLRHVSDAYAEDPLRVLRGVQIASRFNLHMVAETVQASRDIHHRYAELSNERVQEEWSKFMLKGRNNLHNGLQVLHDTGWDQHLDLQDIDRTNTAQRAQDVMLFASRRGADVEFFGTASFALELPVEKREQFIKNVLVGNRRQTKVARLVGMGVPEGLNSRKEVKRWARSIGDKGLSVKEWETLYSKHVDGDRSAYVKRVADIARKNGCYESAHADLVTGEMIMSQTGSARGGRWVGQIILRAKQAQDEEVFMNEDEARQWLINDLNSSRIVD